MGSKDQNAPLQTFIHSASDEGLSSITTLIVGSKNAVLIDPPHLIADGKSVVKWIKETTTLPLKAIFVTHHHPDHFYSADIILDAFPAAKLYAAPYVRAGIDREYDDKVVYWNEMLPGKMIERPRKPEPYPFSFFVIDGNPESPIMLLGPVQGDTVDHTLFWLPREKTIICGDAVYARSTHVWCDEVETAHLLVAWQKTLDLIESLSPTKVIPGHLSRGAGWELDAKADLAHTRKYLDLFAEKITYAAKKPTVDDLTKTFSESFPQAKVAADFFISHLANDFGEGGKVWEENKHHNVGARTEEGLLGYIVK